MIFNNFGIEARSHADLPRSYLDVLSVGITNDSVVPVSNFEY